MAAWLPLFDSAGTFPREGAALAMSSIGDTSAVPALIESLKDPLETIRRAAAHALGRIGDPRAAGAVAAATTNPVEQVALTAVEALGSLRAEEAVDTLIALLEPARADEHEQMARVAYDALSRLANVPEAMRFDGPFRTLPLSAASKQRLVDLINQRTDRTARYRAAHVAGLTGDTSFVPLLERYLLDRSAQERSSVVVSLAILAREGAFEPLSQIFSNRRESEFLRAISAWMIARFGGAAGIEFLRPHVRDDTRESILTRILAGLGQSEQEDAADLLLRFIQTTPNVRLRTFATQDLAMLGSRALAQLRTLATDSSIAVRYWAIDGMRRSGDLATADVLVPFLSDTNFAVRTQALEALHAVGWSPRDSRESLFARFVEGEIDNVRPEEERYLPELVPTLDADQLRQNSWTPLARRSAARALAFGDSATAVVTLVGLLDDRDFQVREEAAHSLSRRGWKPQNDAERASFFAAARTIDSLVSLGDPAVDPVVRIFRRDIHLQPWAALWLSQVGASAIPPLIEEFTGDSDQNARWAGEALVMIGPEAEPALRELSNSRNRRNRERARIALANLEQGSGTPAVGGFRPAQARDTAQAGGAR